jgi:hypothetical protein
MPSRARLDSRGGCPYVSIADIRCISRDRFKLKAKS